MDGLFILTLATAVLALHLQNIFIALLASVFYTWTGIGGHNFFHQRDNHRMRYFNLLFMSYHDWRISHALSHHLYPNSLLDLEILLFEPVFMWTPSKAKSSFQRYGARIYFLVIYAIVLYFEFIKR